MRKPKTKSKNPGSGKPKGVQTMTPNELIKTRRALFMTPAELRGEAAYIVLRLALHRMIVSEVQRIEAAAILEAEKIGLEPLTEEIECLFRSIEYELPAH